METLRRRLAEQKERHQGGSKWIGTAGTSPFGAHGYNPEGVRIGQQEGERNRTRGQGLGPARVPQSRRHGRARHPQHQAGAAPAAPVRPRGGRPRSSTSTAPIKLDRAQRRLARPEAGAGAAQRRQALAVPRCRRVDGGPRPGVRGVVFGRALRVQASDAFLFPQLPLRHGMARFAPPPCRAGAGHGVDPHL